MSDWLIVSFSYSLTGKSNKLFFVFFTKRSWHRYDGLITQGCALAELGGPRRLTFAPG